MDGSATIGFQNGASDISRLLAALAAFPGQRFALVDGGLFDDLPALFKRDRLFARSLFLDTADTAVQAAGPWLVALDQEATALDRVLALPAKKPALMFWSCADGEGVLYRHLRTLNMARIPDWAADGHPAPPDPGATTIYETVFFRHWDPRVLGALLPTLDATQFSRILGPAEEIAFEAPEYGGFKRVPIDRTWPGAPPGLLTVRPEQCLALIDRRVSASHWKLAAYLRTYAPDQTAHLDDDGLLAAVRLHESEAQGFGVRSERSIGLWSYMRQTSVADLSCEPYVVRFMAHPRNGSTPEARLEALFDHRRDTLAMRHAS